eukprot:TRINITY_DN297_c0_g1_i13.p1 TRINITY_DN297_c0_g1~~TRINITY_DN297_c0_g1_i13.p1  ORF type:complete len:412 (+),score=-13.75 TRINITY_DN297_c0_g1_i13:41-1237(+)
MLINLQPEYQIVINAKHIAQQMNSYTKHGLNYTTIVNVISALIRLNMPRFGSRGHRHHFHSHRGHGIHRFHSHHGGGSYGPPITWYFWAKHRSIIGIYVLTVITLIFTIVDISLGLTKYKDKIGYLAYLIIEADVLLIVLQAVNFISTFNKKWLIAGYYCQLTLSILGFLLAMGLRFPIAMVIGLDRGKYSAGKSRPFPGDVLGVGIAMGIVEFIGFMVWSLIPVCLLTEDPDFMEYRKNYLLNLMPNLQTVGVGQVAPQDPVQAEQQIVLMEQVRQLQAQITELRSAQGVNVTAVTDQNMTNYPVYQPAATPQMKQHNKINNIILSIVIRQQIQIYLSQRSNFLFNLVSNIKLQRETHIRAIIINKQSSQCLKDSTKKNSHLLKVNGNPASVPRNTN